METFQYRFKDLGCSVVAVKAAKELRHSLHRTIRIYLKVISEYVKDSEVIQALMEKNNYGMLSSDSNSVVHQFSDPGENYKFWKSWQHMCSALETTLRDTVRFATALNGFQGEYNNFKVHNALKNLCDLMHVRSKILLMRIFG